MITWLHFEFNHAILIHVAAAAAKSLQSCLTLCDPIDGSPSGSPVPGILQARTLEWVAISFSNAWKWKVKVKSLSRVQLLGTPWTAAYQAPPSMRFPRQEYWSGVPLPSPWYTLENDKNSVPLLSLRCWCLVTKSCLTLCDPMDCSPPGSSVHGISQARTLTGVGCHFLLQGIFLTQGPVSPALEAASLPLSHQGGRRQWHSTPVLLPGKSHGWRSLVGCSPWGP